MKIRLAVTAVLFLAATGAFAALSSQYTDWAKGPAHFLMTKDELAKWKTITTDEEAKAFVDLFWARRDPTPATPLNEAREAFEARVRWADENFGFRTTKGSLTDRGKIVVLYGQPKRVERAATGGADFEATNVDRSTWVQWVYEGSEAETLFGAAKVTIRFGDRLGNGDFKLERSTADMTKAQTGLVTRMIVSPSLTTVPTYASAAPAPRPAAPATVAAAPVVTTLTSEALASAVMDFKAAAKNPYAGKAFVSWGEYVTPMGEYFVPVMVSVPANAGLTAGQDVTFFGIVENEQGQPVLAFEEPRKISAAKDDLYVAKSLALPAGKQRGIFGIAAAGKPVVLASADMTTAGTLDKDATAISQLVLAAYVEPMAEAQRPTEPFSFGGVRIIPKADKTFRKTDELWYFFELRHPGLADTITAAEGTRTGAPSEQLPKVQVKMDVTGKLTDGTPVKRAAPLAEVNAVAMKGVPGHYGVGNSIPLESFKPGEYTFTLKVIDTIKKASYTLSETFRVVE